MGVGSERLAPRPALPSAAAGAGIVALILALIGSNPWLAAGAAAAIAGLCLLPFLQFLLLPYFALVLGAPLFASDMPLRIAVRWYGADLALVFAAAGIAWRLLRRTPSAAPAWRHTAAERWQMTAVLCASLYGAVPLVIGLGLSSHAFTDVLGDFRRFYMYPLAMLAPLLLPLPGPHRDGLRHVFHAACMLLLLMGAYRVFTGARWMEELYTLADNEMRQTRILSHSETMKMTAVAAFLAASAAAGGHAFRRFVQLCLLAACACLMIVSGWRLGVIYALGAPVAAVGLLRVLRRAPLRGMIVPVALAAVLMAAGLGLFAVAFPADFSETMTKLEHRFSNVGTEPDSRRYSWARALEEFSAAPVLGKGLGHQLYYFFRGSDGQFLGEYGSTHNIFLDLLYQTGALGLTVFLSVHALFLVIAARGLRRVPEHRHPAAIGLLAGYFAIWGFALMQPLQVGAYVALYLCMGFLLLLMRPEAVEPRPDA